MVSLPSIRASLCRPPSPFLNTGTTNSGAGCAWRQPRNARPKAPDRTDAADATTANVAPRSAHRQPLNTNTQDIAVALGDALESRQQQQQQPGAEEACSLALQRARAAQASALRACDELALRASALAASASAAEQQQQAKTDPDPAERIRMRERERALAASADALRARLASGGKGGG
jgi:hypothetical protein